MGFETLRERFFFYLSHRVTGYKLQVTGDAEVTNGRCDKRKTEEKISNLNLPNAIAFLGNNNYL